MAAPKHNQFFKNRSKHGRDLLFATPELLWEAACEYFNWCDAHPWYKVEAIKSGDMAGELMKVPTVRPYSLSGLAYYVGASESWWRNFKINKNLSDDILTVITQIETVIDTQQFEGGAVGAFNQNIIARKLGLVEKTESKNENINYNTKDLSAEEIKAIGKALENEF